MLKDSKFLCPVSAVRCRSSSSSMVVRRSIGVPLSIVPGDVVAGDVDADCDDPLARLATRPHVLS